MPKRKMTSGVLARDKNGDIVFFNGQRRKDVELMADGLWTWRKTSSIGDLTEFTPEDWKKTYDLKPPRRGSVFEVEIEL